MDNDLKKVVKILENNGLHQESNIIALIIAGLIRGVRIEAIEWTWAKACADINDNKDIRKRDIPNLVKRGENKLINKE